VRDQSPLVTIVTVVCLVVAACTDTSAGGAGCGNPIREALDPQSGLHLLDPETIVYLSDPPTSGPHVGVVPSGGAQAEPVPRPIQVALLEAGGVMVQYGPITDIDRLALEALAGDLVVVAPSDDLEPDEIVATAWLHKVGCGALDIGALRAFVDDHLGELDGHS
jgi:hypothetical protein